VSLHQARAAFSEIYQHDHWEAGSGIGSMMEHVKPYLAFLAEFIRNNTIRSVVDVGCGDWQFSSAMDWSGISYRGFDLVEPVIAANRARFGADNITFDVMEEATVLPRADLAICKDVMQHLPNGDVAALLQRLKENYRYALVTNDIFPDVNRNGDIAYGGWRALRLDEPPFREQGPVLLRYDVKHGERHWTKDVRLVLGAEPPLVDRPDPRRPGAD